MPVESSCVDTVVTTWTLCTIPDAATALAEMRRVLRGRRSARFRRTWTGPGGIVRWWQNGLTPVWKRIGGGCHLNRPIDVMLTGAVFRIERLQTGYAPDPKPMTFLYEGYASRQ
jgi:hypothetical protein